MRIETTKSDNFDYDIAFKGLTDFYSEAETSQSGDKNAQNVLEPKPSGSKTQPGLFEIWISVVSLKQKTKRKERNVYKQNM